MSIGPERTSMHRSETPRSVYVEPFSLNRVLYDYPYVPPDHFIDTFRTHLIETCEAMGVEVVEQADADIVVRGTFLAVDKSALFEVDAKIAIGEETIPCHLRYGINPFDALLVRRGGEMSLGKHWRNSARKIAYLVAKNDGTTSTDGKFVLVYFLIAAIFSVLFGLLGRSLVLDNAVFKKPSEAPTLGIICLLLFTVATFCFAGAVAPNRVLEDRSALWIQSMIGGSTILSYFWRDRRLGYRTCRRTDLYRDVWTVAPVDRHAPPAFIRLRTRRGTGPGIGVPGTSP